MHVKMLSGPKAGAATRVYLAHMLMPWQGKSDASTSAPPAGRSGEADERKRRMAENAARLFGPLPDLRSCQRWGGAAWAQL